MGEVQEMKWTHFLKDSDDDGDDLLSQIIDLCRRLPEMSSSGWNGTGWDCREKSIFSTNQLVSKFFQYSLDGLFPLPCEASELRLHLELNEE